jgi:hypothetical protein
MQVRIEGVIILSLCRRMAQRSQTRYEAVEQVCDRL